MHKTLKLSLLTLVAISIIALSFGAGFVFAHSLYQTWIIPPPPADVPKELKTVWETWEFLRRDFVDPDAVDPKKLSEGAIKGMLEELGDSHTSFIDPMHYALEENRFRGSFEGIGAEVTMEDKQLTIVAPFADSPAEKAGVRPGDRIVEVNGEPTLEMTLPQAVAKIRGPRGTEVRLLIQHRGQQDTVEVSIVRDEIKTESVRLKMLPQGIAHLRITRFAERTGVETRSALQQIQSENAQGIIIDLRDNAGGLLDTTLDVANQFVKEGLLAYQVNREGKRTEWKAKGNGLATDIPLVVLVNHYSASGSEILAAALQDSGRAVLIGETTYGKGTVNHIRELSDGSALYITVARWYTPQGHQIEGNGLTPDIPLQRTEDDLMRGVDPQLDRAVQYLREGAGNEDATA